MVQLAKQGEVIYQQDIFPILDTVELKGKIVAIDVDTKDYFIENTVLKAVMLGRKKYPQHQFYCKRIGYNAVYSHKSYIPTRIEDSS
jgi:hypothetical protein